MNEVHVVEDRARAGVVYISGDPALPAPRVGVLGAIHGNETCGLEAVRRVRRMAEMGELPVRDGTVVLIHGNPAATEQGRRFTEGGEDLNRILDYGFVERLPEAAWTSEHRRALALRDVLESLDALLDLHSATEATPPFAIVNDVDGSLLLAQQCGVRAVTWAWKELRDRVTIGVLGRRGKPAVSVECGQHEASAAIDEALAIAMRFLRATGAVDGAVPEPAPVLKLAVTEVLTKPSAGFRFASPIEGLEELPAGHLIGGSERMEIRTRNRCVALLPNDQAEVGEDLLYLADPV